MKVMSKRAWLKISLGAVALGVLSFSLSPPTMAATKTLKIGVLGVMSGAAASWGLVNRYCAETSAKMINDKGGFPIGDDKYMIEIISIDDKNDPKLAISGAKRLVHEEGVKYIIGPNIDTTAAAIVPVMEDGKAINVPYAFARDLYTPPRGNSILGMIASYQAGPVIYARLQKANGVKTISFVARNESDSLNQKSQGVKAARDLGLKVLSYRDSYEPGTTDFFPIISRIVKKNPDLLVLSGVAPSDAPLILKSARELGFKGLISTETAQDAKILREVAGDAADGFISVGGASTPEIRSAEMDEFIKVYKSIVGEWNDEAGTKVYALEILLRAIQAAGPAAVSDVEVFKKILPTFSVKNPYVKGDEMLKFVGSAYFQQPRQISVPMVVNQYKGGKFVTMFVGSVE